jgi:thioredoxin-like negative regulator of GroEL
MGAADRGFPSTLRQELVGTLGRVSSPDSNAEATAESRRVRGLVIEAVEAAAGLMRCDDVAARWEEPSALAGMTVGALSAHLVRAAGSVLAYLDRTDPATRPDGALLTPVTYSQAAVDSPIHERIKEVSATEATAGPGEVAARCEAVAAALRIRLAEESSDRLVGALGGRMLSLDDFCRTRLIEVLVHVDDLAVSVGLPRPDTSEESTAIVIDILIGIARMVHGDWAVLHALARNERRAVDVFPVF